MRATYDTTTGTWVARHPRRPLDIIGRGNTKAHAEAQAEQYLREERTARL